MYPLRTPPVNILDRVLALVAIFPLHVAQEFTLRVPLNGVDDSNFFFPVLPGRRSPLLLVGFGTGAVLLGRTGNSGSRTFGRGLRSRGAEGRATTLARSRRVVLRTSSDVFEVLVNRLLSASVEFVSKYSGVQCRLL